MKAKAAKHGRAQKARHALKRAGYKIMGKSARSAPEDIAPRSGDAADNISLLAGTRDAPDLKLKTGGAVSGKASAPRLDKRARGGRLKPGTKINIIVAPGGGDAKPPMPMPPMPMPPPPMPMAGPPPGAPPGVPAGRPAMKKGGRVSQKLLTGGTVRMDAGGGGAKGRMEKIKAYGKRPSANA